MSPDPSADSLSITFYNTSGRDGSFVCFQPSHSGMTLVWWAKYTHPRTRIRFGWTLQHQMVWSEMGDLKPGVVVWPNEILAADPLGRAGPNTVGFDDVNGAFEFHDPGTYGVSGSLTIKAGSTVPASTAVIGIGMSGLATAAAPALANQSVQFTPADAYWIAFGTYRQGEVIDPSQIANAVQVSFPANVNAMTAIFDDGGNWSVAPTGRLQTSLDPAVLRDLATIDQHTDAG
jgi:hypothetical protein